MLSWTQASRPAWTLSTKAPSCAHAAAAAAARVWQMPQNLSTAGHRQPEPEEAASSFINQQQTKREEEEGGGYIIYIEFNNNSWAAVDVAARSGCVGCCWPLLIGAKICIDRRWRYDGGMPPLPLPHAACLSGDAATVASLRLWWMIAGGQGGQGGHSTLTTFAGAGEKPRRNSGAVALISMPSASCTEIGLPHTPHTLLFQSLPFLLHLLRLLSHS